MSYFTIYGIAAIGHIVIQLLFGHLASKQEMKHDSEFPPAPGPRLVSVVVPVYNESPAAIRRCLESIAAQDHDCLEVMVVDDGSDNQREHENVYQDFASRAGWRILKESTNRGKRLAQRVAFDRARGDLIVTIDSDTVLEAPDALRQIQRRFSDPRVGAVCGNVGVENERTNLLTKLISYRYWMAFNQERAAQSLFGVTMCCSGPFSAYRGQLIQRLKGEYTRQRFLGRPCTFGDDRHLTNLVLREGYHVVFDPLARARTNVPSSLRSYLSQQLRWNKSFYREAIWTARFAGRSNAYLGVDLLLQLALPFLLMVAIVSVIHRAAAEDPSRLWAYGLVISGISVMRGLYGLVRTGDFGFMLFGIYGFMHIGLLIPTRLFALATMRRTHWGSRT